MFQSMMAIYFGPYKQSILVRILEPIKKQESLRLAEVNFKILR